MRGKKGNKREKRGTQIKRTPTYAVELIHGRHPTSSSSYPDSVYLFSTHFFLPHPLPYRKQELAWRQGRAIL